MADWVWKGFWVFNKISFNKFLDSITFSMRKVHNQKKTRGNDNDNDENSGHYVVSKICLKLDNFSQSVSLTQYAVLSVLPAQSACPFQLTSWEV